MFRSGVADAGHVPAGTGPIGGITARWTLETDAELWSSPAETGETVYVGSTDSTLYALAEG